MALTDTRLYHVPARYASFAEMSPSSVLQEMKTQLVEQFQNIAVGGGGAGAGSAAEALTLQNFFQQIKQMTSKKPDTEGGMIANALMREVINRATKLGTGLHGQGYQAGRQWFRMMGNNGQERGKAFEQELAAIIAAVVNMTGGNTTQASLMTGFGTLGSVNVGGFSGKDAMGDALHEFCGQYVQDVGSKVEKVARDMQKHSNGLVTMAVSGKIDVTALTCDYTFAATGNEEFDKVALLLKSATFTAKSYSSMTNAWSEELKKYVWQESSRSELHLGSTNSNRIYLDMLMKFGNLPYPVAASFYYRAMSSKKGKDTRDTLSRLRWIYELTGYGQTYLTSWFQERIAAESGMGAKYMIFNDPASNAIYVKSTAEIISDVMSKFVQYLRGSQSVLSKSYMAGGDW